MLRFFLLKNTRKIEKKIFVYCFKNSKKRAWVFLQTQKNENFTLSIYVLQSFSSHNYPFIIFTFLYKYHLCRKQNMTYLYKILIQIDSAQYKGESISKIGQFRQWTVPGECQINMIIRPRGTLICLMIS